MSTNCLVKSYALLKEFPNTKKMGRSNKFENTLIDEKAMNDFILLRTELMPITSFYPTY